jgi:hypothetical protein
MTTITVIGFGKITSAKLIEPFEKGHYVRRVSDDQNAFQQIQLLLNTKELTSLGPEQRVSREPLKSLEGKLARLFSETSVPPSAKPLICALVLLWHDYLDESHSISQGIHNEDGSFLHGIMHRREPDYGNAKYWFQRVGEHPCYPIIAEKAYKILSDTNSHEFKQKLIHDANWDAFAFIDPCESALRKNNELTISILKQIQEIEFKTLLEHFLR